jgi:hypothetical protein
MSFSDGWAAINLEMPARVPHTEYSVASHWEVIGRVTGIQVGPHDPLDRRWAASKALMRAWNFDLNWSTLTSNEIFGSLQTDMGHAEYEAEGVDRRDTITCPFKTPEEVLHLDFYQAYGELDKPAYTRKFEEHYHNACRELPDQVNMTGIYVSMVSGLIAVFGWDMLLLAAGVDPAAFGALTDRYAAWIQQYFDALGAADVPLVMIHDDIVWSSGPFISPRWYRKHIFSNYRKLFRPILESGKKILYTSDGNYTQFIDDIAACGVHGFVMEPTTDMAYIAEKYGKTHVFIGNADTRFLLSGTREQIRAEVERCMAIGKPYPGYFLAVGNHIPANTPVDNVLYYMDWYEKLSRR